jgi:hypothetical protein
MILQPKTYPLNRHTYGTPRLKNLYSHSFGYTITHKKVSAGSASAIASALAASTGTPVTYSTAIGSAITQPDVPRALSVTPGGTTANVLDSVVEVFGTNIEGKPISERFRLANAQSTVTNGTKAFRTVTRIVVDGQAGTGVTISVGTQNKLGTNHRLFNQNTTVKIYQATAVHEAGSTPTGLALQGAPTIVANERDLELNLVTPATTPDGTTFLVICYTFDNWALAPVNDNPEYSTSTSTSSTSSSTSTTITTSTSTSSTSSSTSSTSSSTSSTSSSTSSTSTSTTTVP